jgi:glycosyltransferase involved in cell wall biosynthesis
MDRPAQVGLEHTVARAAFVAAVCSFGRSQILKWVPHTLWAKVKVIRCGLAPGYGEAASAPDPMQARLLCIGRLSKEKGQLLLVEAAHKLHQEGIPIRITLAGDGPMRPEIEELVRRLDLVGHVEITGWLDSEGIEALLRASRALVVPSLSEGLPVVIMEAMANRRPVIAPYLAGIPELVSPGLSGWLFPAGDVDSLAQSMHACLTAAPQTLLGMGEAARQAVWRAHDSDREAAGLAHLFGLSIVDNPRP